MACRASCNACAHSDSRTLNPLRLVQNYEVIGNPTPSISVPTHWSKVILALRAPRGMDPLKTTEREVSLAGFVMPNAVIPDNAPLESFLVPGTS